MLGAEVSEDTRMYIVVVNEEEQYSIWLAERALPAGWRAVGETARGVSVSRISIAHGPTCAR